MKKLQSKIIFSLCCWLFLVILTPRTSKAELCNHTNPLRFVIYYNGDFDKMLDKDSKLISFLEAYDLEVVNTFEIDQENKGFTIEDRKGNIIDPYDLARELSLYDGIIAVETIIGPPIKPTI